MKAHRSTLLLLATILILACNFPLVGTAAITPTQTAAAPATAVEAVAIATEAPTATAAATATVAVAPSASVPAASPNGQPVNCRSGPGLSWSVDAILQPGQTAQIVARTSDGAWLQVKNPALSGNLCWVSAAVVTVTGSLDGVQVVAAPPTAVASATSEAAVVVTDVSVSVSPDTISVPGCMGPIQPSTLTATIEVNGAIKIQWHFETQQNGSLSKHSLNFTKAGAKDVSQTFTPPLTAGKFRVELFIDGMNLKGMDGVVFYKISC